MNNIFFFTKLLSVSFIMIFIFSINLIAENPLDSNWKRFFSEPTIGPCSPVNNIIADDDGIFISGYFENENEYLQTLNGIAKWGDSLWLPLGNSSPIGLNGIPISMLKRNDKIYVGGCFDSAGTISANNIACFSLTSNSWSALGNGTNGAVHAITFCNDTLYAGGSFDTAGTTATMNIAKWDGTSWLGLNEGINGTVFTMSSLNNELFIGGRFDTAGNVHSQNIVRFCSNSQTWSSLGSGLNNDVYSIYIIDSTIYAGGEFDTAYNESSTITANAIVSWNSCSWSQVGGGIIGEIFSINQYGNDLIIGGNFTLINDDTTHNLAVYDWNNWSGLGSGTDGFVSSISVYSNDVYIGGTFFETGDSLSKFVGLWSISPPQPIINSSINYSNRFKDSGIKLVSYPNPFSKSVNIRFNVKHSEHFKIRIINVFGTEVDVLLDKYINENEKTIIWKPKNLDSGIYYLQLITTQNNLVNKLIYLSD